MATPRFSRTRMLEHLEHSLRCEALEFERLNGFPFDRMNGTAQCKNQEALVSYGALVALRATIRDIENGYV
jgi:hypothetical protein